MKTAIHLPTSSSQTSPAKVAMLVIAISAFVGCKSAPPNTPARPAASVTKDAPEQPERLSYGAVTSWVTKGITTQNRLIELFGGPNITTLDADGTETWVYERTGSRTETARDDSALSRWAQNIQDSGSSMREVSERGFRTLTVIFKFNQDKTVKDFSARASYF